MKLCTNTPTAVLILQLQSLCFCAVAAAAAILDRNEPIRSEEQNELLPLQYACPPFWIEMNQSKKSIKMSCFLSSTHGRHFELNSILK